MENAQKPNQHIMAIVTFIALVPLVYFVPDWVAIFLPESKLLNVIAAVGIIVPIVSYLIMPWFIRLFCATKSGHFS